MSKIARFGISANPRLMENFDRIIAERGYLNRSEAIRGLIRGELGQFAAVKTNDTMVGTITVVYDRKFKEKITERLARLQQLKLNRIISSLHIKLDELQCLEVLVVKGKAGSIKSISNRLLVTKGVTQVKLSMSATDREI